jgi:hypothetical protein
VDARAAKAATTTIPIVFGLAADPVEIGLVASTIREDGKLRPRTDLKLSKSARTCNLLFGRQLLIVKDQRTE